MSKLLLSAIILLTFFSLSHSEASSVKLETGVMVSAFLEATGAEKIYVSPSQVMVGEHGITFLSDEGEWIGADMFSSDNKGFYISGYEGRKCPHCQLTDPGCCQPCRFCGK